MQDSPTRGQVILVLLLGVLWGLNWPTVKIALAEIGPWTLRASALSLASLALVAITLIRGRNHVYASAGCFDHPAAMDEL